MHVLKGVAGHADIPPVAGWAGRENGIILTPNDPPAVTFGPNRLPMEWGIWPSVHTSPL